MSAKGSMHEKGRRSSSEWWQVRETRTYTPCDVLSSAAATLVEGAELGPDAILCFAANSSACPHIPKPWARVRRVESGRSGAGYAHLFLL